jgi:predicted enzyme related to lactoylglutathione lyase
MRGGYITVDDVDAAARKAEDLGGKVLIPPTDIPNVGRFSALMGPQGVMFSVITYLPK